MPVSVASCTVDGFSGMAVRDYTTTPLLPPCAVRRRRPSRHRLRATDDETSKSWSWLSRFVARSLLALVVVYGTPIVLFAHCQWPCAALLSAWARNFVSPVIVVDCCIAPLFSLFLRSSGRQLKHCAVQCVLLVLPLCLLFSHTDIYSCATNHVVVITLDFLFVSTCVDSTLSSLPVVAMEQCAIRLVRVAIVVAVPICQHIHAILLVLCALLCTVTAVSIFSAMLLYVCICDLYRELCCCIHRVPVAAYTATATCACVLRVCNTVLKLATMPICQNIYASVLVLGALLCTVTAVGIFCIVVSYFSICDLYRGLCQCMYATVLVMCDLYRRLCQCIYATVLVLWHAVLECLTRFGKALYSAASASAVATAVVTAVVTATMSACLDFAASLRHTVCAVRRVLRRAVPRTVRRAVRRAVRALYSAASAVATAVVAMRRAVRRTVRRAVRRAVRAVRPVRRAVRALRLRLARLRSRLRRRLYRFWVSAMPKTRARIFRFVMYCNLSFLLCWWRVQKKQCESHADVARLLLHYMCCYLRRIKESIVDGVSSRLLHAQLSVTTTWARISAYCVLLLKKPRRSFSRRARRSWYFKFLSGPSSFSSSSGQSDAAYFDLHSYCLRLACTSAHALFTSFSPFAVPVSVLVLLLALSFVTATAVRFPATRFAPVAVDSMSFFEWVWQYRLDLATKGTHCFAFACFRWLLFLVSFHAHITHIVSPGTALRIHSAATVCAAYTLYPLLACCAVRT